MIENAQDTGSRIGTDRSCTGCGFNLIHQPIVREPSHNLLISICPECGTAAPLISYPLMSRWVGRWKLVLAVVWVALLVAMFAWQCQILTNRVFNDTSSIALPLAEKFGRAYFEWASDQGTLNTNQQWAIDQQRYEYLTIEMDWLNSEGQALLKQADTAGLLLRWQIFLRAVPVFTISFLFGLFWSAIALGAKRRSLIPVAFLAMLIPLLLVIGKRATLLYYYNASWIAGNEVIIPYALMIFSLAFVFMLLGIWSGRPITRWIVRTTLPPNMLPPLAILWTRDGLIPPR